MPCSLSPARQPRWWLPSPQAQKEPRWAEQAEASVNQRSVPNSAAIVVSERTWEDGIPGLYVQFLKRKVLTQLKSKLLRGLAGGGPCGARPGSAANGTESRCFAWPAAVRVPAPFPLQLHCLPAANSHTVPTLPHSVSRTLHALLHIPWFCTNTVPLQPHLPNSS